VPIRVGPGETWLRVRFFCLFPLIWSLGQLFSQFPPVLRPACAGYLFFGKCSSPARVFSPSHGTSLFLPFKHFFFVCLVFGFFFLFCLWWLRDYLPLVPPQVLALCSWRKLSTPSNTCRPISGCLSNPCLEGVPLSQTDGLAHPPLPRPLVGSPLFFRFFPTTAP